VSPQEQTAAQASTQTQEANLFDVLLEKGFNATKEERDRPAELVSALVEEALKGTVTWDKNVGQTIKAGIAALDAAIPSSWPPSCTTPTSRSWKGRGAA